MKKRISKSLLFSGILFCNTILAENTSTDRIEFTENEVFIPSRLRPLKLYKDTNGFHVLKDDKIYDIQNCFCDPLLCKMSNKQLKMFLGRYKPKLIAISPEEFSRINPENIIEIIGPEKEKMLSQLFGSGYIALSQWDDGEYALCAKIRVLGGGYPIWLGMVIGGVAGGAVGMIAGTLIGAKWGAWGVGIGIVVGGVAGGTVGAGIGYGITNVENHFEAQRQHDEENPIMTLIIRQPLDWQRYSNNPQDTNLFR